MKGISRHLESSKVRQLQNIEASAIIYKQQAVESRGYQPEGHGPLGVIVNFLGGNEET